MKKIICVFLSLIILINDYAQSNNWKIVNHGNTGVAGSYHYQVTGDCKGNIWSSGYVPNDDYASVFRWDSTGRMTHWSNFEGYLPGRDIMSVAFDSLNHLWVGTDSGFANYNGNTWQIFNASNTILDDDVVMDIAIDQNNVLWAAMSEFGASGIYGGIAKYDGTTWTYYKPSNSPLPTAPCNAVAVDHNNVKWFGTWNGGLVKFDGNNWTIYNTSNSGISANSIYKIQIDSLNRVWVITGASLDMFDGTNWTHINSSNSPMTGSNNGSFYIRGNKIIIGRWGQFGGGVMIYNGNSWSQYTLGWVDGVFIDKNFNYWAAGIGFIRKFNGSTWQIYNQYTNGISWGLLDDIFIDSHNRKWVSGGNAGMQTFECHDKFENYGLFNQGLFPQPNFLIATTAYEDAKGDVWFAGGDVVVQVPDGNYSNYSSWIYWDTAAKGGWYGIIDDFASDSAGNMYAQTEYQYIHFYNRATNSWSVINTGMGLYSSYSMCAKPNTSKVYTSLYNQIIIYDNGIIDSVIDFNALGYEVGVPYDIEFAPNNDLWVAGDSGVWKFDGSSWTNYNHSNSGIVADHITSIEILNSDTIYFGGFQTQNAPYYGGFSIYKVSTNTFTTFLYGSSPLPNKQVEDMELDSLKNLWILVSGVGFVVYKPGGLVGFNCVDTTLHACPSGGPLPVTLLNFQARKANKTTAQLLWQTATEINNRGFEIQRSFDGINFTTVKFVPGAVNSDNLKEYSATDVPGRTGRIFYRLKQIDLDGNSKLSGIASLLFTKSEIIKIFPNPAQQIVTVEGIDDFSSVQVLDITGKLMKEVKTYNQYQVDINLYGFVNGVYLLRLANDKETQLIKLIISK